MIDREDIQHAELAETNGDNLVLINQSKYILNWDASSIVNTSPQRTLARHRVSQDKIKQQLR
jgi:hypothetical protein